jgi:predicted phage tail protein
MMRDVFLYGAAGRQFGRHFRLDVASPNEAVRALMTLRPGLRAVIRQGYWRIIVGSPHIKNAIQVHTAGMNLGALPLHLVPSTGAAGGGDGVGKIAAGVVLIGASIVTAGLAAPAGFAAMGTLGGFGAAMTGATFMGISAASVAVLGASMVLGGVAGMLSQPPQGIPGANASATDAATMNRPEDRPSFLFNGIVNNTAQGGPVTLVFGTHLVGSVVVSADVYASDIAP